LIDAHVHLATTSRPPAVLAALMQATLLGGVTAVRDMGGNGAIVSGLSRAAAAPGAASPAIYSSAVFAGPDSMWFTDPRAAYFADGRELVDAPWLVRVDRNTNIRDAVRRAKAFGVTGVKLYSHLTRSVVDDIADAARRERLAVWTHSTVGPATPRDAIDARATTLSHADFLVWQGRTGVPLTLFGRPQGMMAAIDAVPAASEAIARVLRDMRERAVMLEPTLYVGLQAASLASDEQRPRYDRQAAYGADVTARAHKAGVRIVAGTDALGGSTPNLHVELQLLVRRAGLSPVEAIRAATVNAAQALGLANEMGSIRPGLRANLVVLDRDPSEDVRNTQTVLLVMRDGVVHRRTIPMPPAPLGEPPAPATR
jgi:predicted amidohydrolase YtcJ